MPEWNVWLLSNKWDDGFMGRVSAKTLSEAGEKAERAFAPWKGKLLIIQHNGPNRLRWKKVHRTCREADQMNDVYQLKNVRGLWVVTKNFRHVLGKKKKLSDAQTLVEREVVLRSYPTNNLFKLPSTNPDKFWHNVFIQSRPKRLSLDDPLPRTGFYAGR